eukprot:jgi/Phyca11/132286/e_gw1.150.14.1
MQDKLISFHNIYQLFIGQSSFKPLKNLSAPEAKAASYATFALKLRGFRCHGLCVKNIMVFQTCVSKGQYKIFPFSDKHPSPQQIDGMARSLACRAIFTSIELSNFPMRATDETLLKIDADIDKFPNSSDTVLSTEQNVLWH